MSTGRGSAVLLLNGDVSRPGLVRRLCRSGAALFCADGGARHAAALGLEPRAVVGDMDSLPRRLPRWRSTAFVCDFDQDRSDLEKALGLAARSGARLLWVAGALGGTLGHELVNLATLETWSGRLRLAVIAGRELAWLLPEGTHRLRARHGDSVTLLPATPTALVTASGLAFPLRRRLLARTSLGLSNSAASTAALVRVHAGRLWAVVGPPPLRRRPRRGHDGRWAARP